MKIPVIIAGLLIVTAIPLSAQVVDTTAMVVCGKSEEPTPCVLILNRSVPSYDLTIKKDDRKLLNFKVDRGEGVWQVLGENRKERLIEVIVDTQDSSYVVVNPRVPGVSKDLIPDGCDGLIIKTVEVQPDKNKK
jgi:hypothetical protein